MEQSSRIQKLSPSVAVMQPYLFPYIGYFQLIQACDIFTFYDTVSFIKGGWINRNRLSSSQGAIYLTVPCKGISSHSKICEVQIDRNNKRFRNALTTVNQLYSRAPFFNEVFPMIAHVLDQNHEDIASLAKQSVIAVSEYLGQSTHFHSASELSQDILNTSRVQRLINIVQHFGGHKYINPAGGHTLYDRHDFVKFGITLEFLKTTIRPYKTFNGDFTPSLSIIDLLMNLPKDQVREHLESYTLHSVIENS